MDCIYGQTNTLLTVWAWHYSLATCSLKHEKCALTQRLERAMQRYEESIIMMRAHISAPYMLPYGHNILSNTLAAYETAASCGQLCTIIKSFFRFFPSEEPKGLRARWNLSTSHPRVSRCHYKPVHVFFFRI